MYHMALLRRQLETMKMKEGTYTGRWWIPSEPTKTVGVLTYTPQQGFSLELTGSLRGGVGALDFSPAEIILGTTSDGVLMTLVDCIKSSGRLKMGDGGIIDSEIWTANVAYIGSHFESLHALQFTSLTLQFSHLVDFGGTPGFSEVRLPLPGTVREQMFSYQLRTDPRREVEAAIPGARLMLEDRFESTSDKFTHVDFRHYMQWRVETDEALPLNLWAKRYMKPLQNLLSLATGTPNALQKIEVTAPTIDSDGVTALTVVEVIVQPSFLGSEPYTPLRQREMLFGFRDITDKYESIIQAWFASYEKLEAVYDYYFAVEYAPDMYLGHRFLNIVFAAEMYGRLRRPHKTFTDQELAERTETILSLVPLEYKGWLRWRMKYGNEPNLEERIVDLAQGSNSLANDLLGSHQDDRREFAKKVADTRNHMAHNNPRLRALAASGAELHHLTLVLSLFLISYFLGEVGLNDDERLKMVRRSRRYRMVMENPEYRSW